MKPIAYCLTFSLLAASAGLLAQTTPSASGGSGVYTPSSARGAKNEAPEPFSRLALGGGIGANGINLQAAVEASRYFNIRGIGNVFSYSLNNVKVSGNGGSNGINVNGKLNFGSAGVALDYYPFPNHGFRLSPGVILYNQNTVSANGTAAQGTSLTLGSTKYYSEGGANAMALNANVGLNTHQRAFSMTTGWGNMISRKGGHFSVPFELGAVFTGAPTLGFNLSGYGCTTQTDDGTNGAGASCVNMATNTTAQTNVAAQVAKYQNDLNVLKVYPIISIGIGYNFKIR